MRSLLRLRPRGEFPMSSKFPLALAVLLSFFAVSALAQFRASIQGTVTDPQGNAVAAARVTLTDQATGINRETVTNDQGFYRINELPPSNYTVTVEVTGFKKSVSQDILVQAEQPRGFDLVLAVGPVNEQVTVSAVEQGLQTEDANVTST